MGDYGTGTSCLLLYFLHDAAVLFRATGAAPHHPSLSTLQSQPDRPSGENVWGLKIQWQERVKSGLVRV
jgi:hypothetical protein